MRLLAPPPTRTLPVSGEPPALTVAIAAYQAETTVAAAVASALAQEPRPAEVLVVDDGSTDATAAVAKALDGPVRVLRRPHAGEAATKNAAAAAARTPVVAYLDADDVLLPGWTAAVTRALQERPDVDLVTADAWLVRDGRRVRRVYDESFPFAVEDQRHELLRRNFVLGLCAVRREAFLASGGFDEAVTTASDWSAWLRLVLHGGVLACIDEPLAEYRLHDASMSADRARLLRGRVSVLKRIAENPEMTPQDRQVLAASVRAQRSTLARVEVREALLAGRSGARRRSLALAVAPAQSGLTRAKAVAAVLLPRRWRRGALGRDALSGGFRGGTTD